VTPRAGANGQQPERWDLETAAKAAAAEAGDVPFAFTYKGRDYEIPNSRNWPADALAQLAAGELDAALPLIVGDDQYGALIEAGLSVGELMTLFDKVASESGLTDLPNSSRPRRRGSTRT
jgi:hypothetical protein